MWPWNEATARNIETATPESHLHLGMLTDHLSPPGWIWDRHVLSGFPAPVATLDVLTRAELRPRWKPHYSDSFVNIRVPLSVYLVNEWVLGLGCPA